MHAIQVNGFGPPSDIAIAEVAEPAGGEVIIDVAAAGVSFPDLLMSQGRYQIQPEPPFTLGVEAAGIVHAAEPGSGFAVGDRVAAFTVGAFADRVAAPAATTFHLPDSLSFAQGAGLVMNYQTAYFGLVLRAGIQAGEVVLIHGAAGGVGTAAIQVARGMGARVFAVVSTDEKAAIATQAGADEVLLSTGDWRREGVALTDGRGVDVVYDPVGGDRTDDSVRALAAEGRLVVIGFADGAIPSLALNRVLLRNISVVGAAWGHFIATRPHVSKQIAEHLARMADDGIVSPIVGKTYPLSQAGQALADLEQRRATGKLVLRTGNHD
jgi:NADPH2:quinone reductase